LPDVFDGIADWLIERALQDVKLSDTVAELGQRLVDGGVPVNRINIGRSMLHPVIGLINLKWEAGSGHVTTEEIPRSVINPAGLEGNPFFDLSRGLTDRIVADLRNPKDVARYDLFQEFAAKGITGYVAFGRKFGRKTTFLESIAEGFRGATLSYATRRFSGFSQTDLAGLERLMTPLCVCLHVATEQLLATELLETYLGGISGKQVLTGQSARGDGQVIDCALLTSDLRNSVGLSQQMDAHAYLATLNAYFDCTAQAVLDHGGEVLKFIGDGILAIFPFEGTTRPPEAMCAAALSAAREAFARADHLNRQRSTESLPTVDFGIALHAGEVIYGNVGTEQRLDFTATGAAVGLVSRCEALTRDLNRRLIATRAFADTCPEPALPLGDHAIRGFADPVSLAFYPETAA
jgi:adenylate cyclase